MQRKSVISDQTDSWTQGTGQIESGARKYSNVQHNSVYYRAHSSMYKVEEDGAEATATLQFQNLSLNTDLEEKKNCISSVYSLKTWQLKQATN